MRILHINKFFDFRGGVEVYLHELMGRQSDRGHDVHILSTWSDTNVATSDAKYFVRRYDFSRFEGVSADAKKSLAFLWNREAEDATRRAIREIKPDVVHLHNIYHHLSSAILLPIRDSRVRCVQTLHDLKLACPNYKMFTNGSVCERCKGGKYWNAILHKCLFPSTIGNILGAVEMTATKSARAYERTVHRFFTPSSFYRDKMIEWGEPASKFSVVLNPAEISEIPATCDEESVLFAGRLVKEKGVDVLIRAAKAVPNLAVKIAGTGPEEFQLQHLVRTLGVTNVSFLGFVHPSKLTAIRRSVKAVIVPSIWYENGPLSVLEALGEGVPVIGSNIGGIPEMVKDGKNGFLVEAGNVASLSSALQKIRDMSSRDCISMGEAGRAHIAKFHDWEKHLDILDREYGKS